MGRVVLVTGVSGYLGGRFARLLAREPAVDRVIGVDVVPPRRDLGAVRFVRADIRNPVIAKVIASEQVDTVVHMSVIATPAGSGERVSMKEINVIGTMQLLAACQKAPTVSTLVVKSSSVVYGSSPRDPAMFTEEMDPRRAPRSGFAKDSVEVEGYVRGFARRRSDVRVVMLRCANLLGPAIQTAMSRYFSLPVVPTVLGFDARLQFCHEDDALAALRLGVVGDAYGTFNIAGDGILMLSQALRRLGRPSLPLPPIVFAAFKSAGRRGRMGDFSSDQIAFLTHGRGMDTTRMRELFGFAPAFTTPATFAEYAAKVPSGLLDADRVQAAEQRVAALLTAAR
jgi:UDP-glucose 4-epimerase